MGATFVPLAASGVVAPITLVEVLTASGNSYYWSEQKILANSVIQDGSLAIASITTSDHRLLGLGGGGQWQSFTVTLQKPASLDAGAMITIVDNSYAGFNGTWVISAILSPTMFKVAFISTFSEVGSGGYCEAPEVAYLDWLTNASFKVTGTTQTDTGSVSVQNISGNTVARDAGSAFSKYEFIGALVVCRIWRGDAEEALFQFMGNVTEAEVNENQMVLTIEGFGNWSAISAPAFNIDVSCPLYFGSVACGSTNPTPCDHSYGNCSSIERFQGVIVEWDVEAPNVQVAQPPPAVFYNPARPF